jgi:hypothetical protein
MRSIVRVLSKVKKNKEKFKKKNTSRNKKKNREDD